MMHLILQVYPSTMPSCCHLRATASWSSLHHQSFDSQQAYLDKLEEQMSALGISTLFQQKMGAETAESKKLSRTDSDSLLSIVSRDLQAMLQTAFEMAGQYVGKEAPLVQLDRDFDLQTLDGNQVGQYLQLWSNGAITQETLLGALKKGEILPDVDVEEEVELTSVKRSWTTCLPKWSQVKLLHLQMKKGVSNVTATSVRQAVERMRGVAERREENDDED